VERSALQEPIEFDSFVHLPRPPNGQARLLLPRRRTAPAQGGRIHDLDTVGRPDTLTVLTALASVTPTSACRNAERDLPRPYELARQLATLDHLSNGAA
jgi:alkanesulfonate monooxygenase SsuD/methylene tetrahydromethanopterin reductase-like flavin-dependent oxidoreductase (luciferase family)